MKEVPDPRGGYPTSYFIGHYGETIELAHDWTAEPKMQSEVEVVRFHRKYTDSWGRHPYQPAESDYKPENFTPMGLMQLIVIPKNAPGGLRSLRTILLAKQNELKRNSANSEIIEVTNDVRWPPGTRLVLTHTPYRLRQVYSESPTEFYILSSGVRLKADDYGFSQDQAANISYAYSRAEESLGAYLLTYPHAQQRPNDLLGYFKSSGRFWLILGLFCGVVLLLAGWPGVSLMTSRIHLLGYSLLCFTILMGLGGFIIVFLPSCFGLYWTNMGAAALVAILPMPWVSWIASKQFGCRQPKRVFFWTFVAAIPLTALFCWIAIAGGAESADEALFFSTLSLLPAGFVFGLTFFFAFGSTRTEVNL